MAWWNGPELRDEIERKVKGAHAIYTYVDDGRKVPEYVAHTVRLRVFFADMGQPRDELRSALLSMPGCLSAMDIPDHKDLRPMVEAHFNRRYKEEQPA